MGMPDTSTEHRWKSRLWAFFHLILGGLCGIFIQRFPYDVKAAIPMYIFGAISALASLIIILTGDTRRHRIHFVLTMAFAAFLFFYSTPLFWFCEDRIEDAHGCWHYSDTMKNWYFAVFSVSAIVMCVDIGFNCSAFSFGWVDDRPDLY